MADTVNYKEYKLIPIDWIITYDNLVDFENEVKETIAKFKNMEKKVFTEMDKELTLTQIAKILAVKKNNNYSYQNIPKEIVNKYKEEVKEKLEKVKGEI